jgi:hypothetical protein
LRAQALSLPLLQDIRTRFIQLGYRLVRAPCALRRPPAGSSRTRSLQSLGARPRESTMGSNAQAPIICVVTLVTGRGECCHCSCLIASADSVSNRWKRHGAGRRRGFPGYEFEMRSRQFVDSAGAEECEGGPFSGGYACWLRFPWALKPG